MSWGSSGMYYEPGWILTAACYCFFGFLSFGFRVFLLLVLGGFLCFCFWVFFNFLFHFLLVFTVFFVLVEQ